MDQGIFEQFRIDWKYMKNWPLILWVVFFGLIALGLLLVRYMARVYLALSIAKYYLLSMVGAFGVFKYFAKGAKEIHIHHY